MDKDTAVRRTAQHDEPINYETAKRVGELRKRLNLTLHDCAEYLGVPVTTLIKWENGTRTPGSSAQRLMDILGMIEVMAPNIHEHFGASTSCLTPRLVRGGGREN